MFPSLWFQRHQEYLKMLAEREEALGNPILGLSWRIANRLSLFIPWWVGAEGCEGCTEADIPCFRGLGGDLAARGSPQLSLNVSGSETRRRSKPLGKPIMSRKASF